MAPWMPKTRKSATRETSKQWAATRPSLSGERVSSWGERPSVLRDATILTEGFDPDAGVYMYLDNFYYWPLKPRRGAGIREGI